MKKVIFVLTVFFTILLSSVSFASCNLDPYRWQWVTSNDQFGVFVDITSIKPSGNFAQFWDCNYWPGSCDIHSGEHYEYRLLYVSYSTNSVGIKSIVVYDAKGRVIDSSTWDYVKYFPIVPGSIGETEAIAIKRIINNTYR